MQRRAEQRRGEKRKEEERRGETNSRGVSVCGHYSFSRCWCKVLTFVQTSTYPVVSLSRTCDVPIHGAFPVVGIGVFVLEPCAQSVLGHRSFDHVWGHEHDGPLCAAVANSEVAIGGLLPYAPRVVPLPEVDVVVPPRRLAVCIARPEIRRGAGENGRRGEGEKK